MINVIIFVVSMVFGSEQALAAARSPKKHLMAAMGDSISAATFSDTSIDEIPHDPSALTLEALASQFNPDEISAEFLFENKRTLSWASGQSITSHFMRLKELIEAASNGAETVEVLNVSFPGNQARHMPGQAKQILKAVSDGKYASVKYITFMIGANDACFDGGPDGPHNVKILADLTLALDILANIKQDEKIRILVSSVPKIPDLGIELVLKTKTLGLFTCESFRDHVFKPCVPMTVWKTKEEYSDRMAIIDRKNDTIRTAIAEATKRHPNLDIRYSDSFYYATIQPWYLAADCFHPNKVGQQIVADMLWAEQPWF